MLKYRKDIDGLRAIAVLSVVLFHAFPSMMPGGFTGVDVFFVISGYLISGILFNEFESNTFTYAGFYTRRIKRIIPALILVLISVLAMGWYTLLAQEFESLGKHAFASVLFFQNFNLIHESGYFDNASELKPLLHLWSLAVEEQFYIFWPPLIAWLLRKKKSVTQGILWGIGISFLVNLPRLEIFPSETFYAIYTRFWELLAGAWLARLHFDHPELKSGFKFSKWASLIGLALLAISFGWINKEDAFPGFYAVIPILGSVLLISSGPNALINRYLLSSRVLVWIGLISYPLYLWHWPILSFVRILSPATALGLGNASMVKGICVFISLLLSYGSYRWLETPIRKRTLKSIGGVPITSVLLLTFFGLGTFGKLIELNQGFSNRFAGKRNEVILRKSADFVPVPLKECNKLYKSENFTDLDWCLTNLIESKQDVVVIGDSHSTSHSEALARYYLTKGRSVTAFGIGDTLGLMGVESKVGGYRTETSIFSFAIREKAKTVILISRGPIFIAPRKTKDFRTIGTRDEKDHSEKNREKIYQNALDRTLKELDLAGIETIFFYDNPDLGFTPEELCLKRPVQPYGVAPLDPCGIPTTRVLERQKTYRSIVQSVVSKYPHVKTFDPYPFLCDDRLCYGIREGTLLYKDAHHYTPEGAEWVGRHFNF